MMNDDYYPTACDDVVWKNWLKIMGKKNESDSLDDIILMLNDKLDKQLNGDVVNDTIVRHIKKSVEKIKDNPSLIGNIENSEMPQESKVWFLIMFALFSSPIKEEDMTDEFKLCLDRYAKEHGLDGNIKGES